jgi:hypothetical protein
MVPTAESENNLDDFQIAGTKLSVVEADFASSYLNPRE